MDDELLSWDQITRIMADFRSHAMAKTIFGLILGLLHWSFGAELGVVGIVFLLMCMDTFFSVWVAYRRLGLRALWERQELVAAWFSRCFSKVVVYLGMLLMGALVDKVLNHEMPSVLGIHLHAALSIVLVFLVTRESHSILKSIQKLGYSVPPALIKVLQTAQAKSAPKSDK